MKRELDCPDGQPSKRARRTERERAIIIDSDSDSEDTKQQGQAIASNAISRLHGNEWLDDCVIDEILRLITAPDSQTFPSPYFDSDEELKLEGKSKALWPLNVNNKHWVATAIVTEDHGKASFWYYDSLSPSLSPTPQVAILEKMNRVQARLKNIDLGPPGQRVSFIYIYIF